jgi:stage II sporulation protein Q
MKPEQPNKPIQMDNAKQGIRWKRLFAKKWAFPAIYLAAAALILTVVWLYQNAQESGVTKPGTDVQISHNTVPVDQKAEQMTAPVPKTADAVVQMGYYDDTASTQAQERALVKYANTYWPHTGIDYARKDGKSFDVVAALSGKVIRVEQNPLVGQEVEIQHENGLVTVYQSLADVRVKVGQQVKQGEVIAKAGRNNFEKEEGVHLHFEVRKDSQPIQPDQYLK